MSSACCQLLVATLCQMFSDVLRSSTADFAKADQIFSFAVWRAIFRAPRSDLLRFGIPWLWPVSRVKEWARGSRYCSSAADLPPIERSCCQRYVGKMYVRKANKAYCMVGWSKLELVLAMIIYNLTLCYETIDKLANCVSQCSTRSTKQKSLHTTNEPMRSTIIFWKRC